MVCCLADAVPVRLVAETSRHLFWRSVLHCRNHLAVRRTPLAAILYTTLVIYVIFLVMFLVLLNAPLPQGNMSPFYDYSDWILRLNTNIQNLW